VVRVKAGKRVAAMAGQPLTAPLGGQPSAGGLQRAAGRLVLAEQRVRQGGHGHLGTLVRPYAIQRWRWRIESCYKLLKRAGQQDSSGSKKVGRQT
jgi:hypothetical protein